VVISRSRSGNRLFIGGFFGFEKVHMASLTHACTCRMHVAGKRVFRQIAGNGIRRAVPG
jgi:hypothetical protein